MSRKEHWEQAYREKDVHGVSWYQQRPELSLQMIARAEMEKTDPVIDIGAGASTLVDCLLAEGYRDLTLLDLSGSALEQVRTRLGEVAAAVEFLVADILEQSLPRTYRLWHDRAVFHFLTDADDRRCYIEQLVESLQPGGQLIIASFAPGGPERCSGLPTMQYDAAGLQRELGDGFRLLEQTSERHLTPNGGEQKFGYFRFLRENP